MFQFNFFSEKDLSAKNVLHISEKFHCLEEQEEKLSTLKFDVRLEIDFNTSELNFWKQ